MFDSIIDQNNEALKPFLSSHRARNTLQPSVSLSIPHGATSSVGMLSSEERVSSARAPEPVASPGGKGWLSTSTSTSAVTDSVSHEERILQEDFLSWHSYCSNRLLLSSSPGRGSSQLDLVTTCIAWTLDDSSLLKWPILFNISCRSPHTVVSANNGICKQTPIQRAAIGSGCSR